jgi:hypothetical protein
MMTVIWPLLGVGVTFLILYFAGAFKKKEDK